MHPTILICRLAVCVALCIATSHLVSRPAAAQTRSPAQTLQADGVSTVDLWIDYVRRTGDAKSTAGDLSRAVSDLNTSQRLFLQSGDLAGAAVSTIKLADISRLQNHFGDAVTTYQKAIGFAHGANRTDYETQALARMSLAELLAGKTDEAKDHASQAASLGERCGNKAFYFEALNQAAYVQLKLGDLRAGADFLDRALAMRASLDDEKVYTAYANRADLYNQRLLKCQSDNREDCSPYLRSSRADYQEAITITKKLNYSFISSIYEGQLQMLDQFASLAFGFSAEREEGMFSPKEPKDVRVTDSFDEGKMSPANVAVAESMYKGIQDWFSRTQQQGLTVIDLNSDDLALKGQIAQWKGDTDAALIAFRRSVELLEQDRRNLHDERERSAFLENKIGTYYSPALLLLNRKRYGEAFSLFEQARSRAMSDMLASRAPNLGTAQERTLFSQLQALRAEIGVQQGKLFNLTGSPDRDQHSAAIVELEGQIDAKQERYRQLQVKIMREAPKLAELTSGRTVTLESVQRSAREGGFDVLYYVVVQPNLIVWHIDGVSVQVMNVFFPNDQISTKTAKLRDTLLAAQQDSRAIFDDTIARELFLFLVQPVLSSIKTTHLVIIPHEQLNSVPFQVLQNPENGRFLGESFAISYAPSATVLASLTERPNLRNGRLLAVADPAMSAAQEEAQAIGELYPGRSKVVTQVSAAKKDIQEWVAGYDMVHLSVHGEFKESDPLMSYLQFRQDPPDNGHLTAADMFGLPLKKGSLVVLSACETGRVEATRTNEVLGMVRSLLYAGAGELVLSAWQVEAKSTKLWMQTFYREGQSHPPSEAARRALVAVRSRPEYSHPFYWAPFLITGK